MTQFSQIELIYNQLLSLVNEITALIENEEYEDAAAKIENKDKLVKQLAAMKKTVNFTDEEKLKMQRIEDTIKEKNDTMLADLKKVREELAKEVNSNKKKIKLNSAYDKQQSNRQGAIIDISE